jgi:ketosteroid isomerase-like protein
MSQADVELVRWIYDQFDDVAALMRDEEAADRVEEKLRSVFSPDVKCVLNGPPYSDIHVTAWGMEGYRKLWRDWSRPFHAYMIEIEELVDLEGRVLALTHGRGQVQSDSQIISNRGGTIWTFEEGLVTAVEHYIERADAEHVAYGRT